MFHKKVGGLSTTNIIEWIEEIETGFGPDTRINCVASRPISGLMDTEMHLKTYNLALCLMIHHSYAVYNLVYDELIDINDSRKG